MWYTIFDVYSGFDGERPKPRREVGVEEHSSCHRCECEIATLGNTVLTRRIGHSFLVGDPLSLAEGFEFPFYKFWGVVDSED
jgi:hypothetical protein